MANSDLKSSEWATLALIMNIPWIGVTLMVLQQVTSATGVIAGEIWLGPMIVWGLTVPFVAIACAIAMHKNRPQKS